MWKSIKGVLLLFVTVAGLILVYVFTQGQGKGDKLFEEAKAKVEKAKLLDEKIAQLKAEKGRLDEETKKEIQRIKKLSSLEEINNEFDKLYQ